MALTKTEKEALIKEYANTASDTGSTEVQVSLLTKNILTLTAHCQKFVKDFSSRRGLLQMVHKRKSLLKYLERVSEERYKKLIERLGLRK